MVPSRTACNYLCILPCTFIEITLQDGCSRVNLLYVSRTPFCKNTLGGLFAPLHFLFNKNQISETIYFLLKIKKAMANKNRFKTVYFQWN